MKIVLRLVIYGVSGYGLLRVKLHAHNWGRVTLACTYPALVKGT